MLLAGVRRRQTEEEGESVFVSMTDLTVSFLFIILILLAFFATQFKPEEMVRRDEYDAVAHELSEAREKIRQLGASLAAERRRVGDLEQETRALAGRLSEAHGTIAELRSSVDGLRKVLAAADAKGRALSARVKELARDLYGARAERDTARARVEALEAEVAHLQRSLSHYEQRVGWLWLRIAELQTPDDLAAYLDEVLEARDFLLERLEQHIRQQLPGIRVQVEKDDGVIRFRGDDLFESGQWRIERGSTAERMSRAVGDALADTLPCYTLGARSTFEVDCNAAFALIETIQIEGHTDDVLLSAPTQARENMKDNYDLSARRGAETLRAVSGFRPELNDFRNLHCQPVLSFSGYGDTRPIADNQTVQDRAANRRIDIRFILHTPHRLSEVREIREQLMRSRPHLPQVVDETVRCLRFPNS